ncbi:MAG: hypothetical protein JWN70_6534 [Planctomycetaceae bacterium]|nr:hypothetical protein [Planctomycetaceae bacterium]
MSQDSTNFAWPATRQRIFRRFLGKLPGHKQQPLNLVKLIHDSFPEWEWVDIAQWMDGSQMPSDVQQVMLSNWEQGLDQSNYSLRHWLAIRSPLTSEIIVFGPYTILDGNDRRDALLYAFQSVELISTVFLADSMEHAKLIADGFMPRGL